MDNSHAHVAGGIARLLLPKHQQRVHDFRLVEPARLPVHEYPFDLVLQCKHLEEADPRLREEPRVRGKQAGHASVVEQALKVEAEIAVQVVAVVELDACSPRFLLELVFDLGVPAYLLGVEVDVGEVARDGVEAGLGFADLFARGGSMNSTMVPGSTSNAFFWKTSRRESICSRGERASVATCRGKSWMSDSQVVRYARSAASSITGSVSFTFLSQRALPIVPVPQQQSHAWPGGVSHAKLGHEPGEGLGGGVLAGDLPLGRGDALFEQPVS